MFAIRKVEISDKQHKVLNICLSDTNLKKLSSCNYTTLILGENGVGKSFLLKSIILNSFVLIFRSHHISFGTPRQYICCMRGST